MTTPPASNPVDANPAELALAALDRRLDVTATDYQALCRSLIDDAQRVKKRMERISRISDGHQGELRDTNKKLQESNARLEQALAEVNTLSGFIPICSKCKRVRDDGGFWDDVEGYLGKQSDVVISLGCCPACSAGLALPTEVNLTAAGDDLSEQARLVAILATPEFQGHALMSHYARLSGDYQKLSRRMHKISRISDGFQTQMKALTQALEHASRTDTLTQLPNRRALIEKIESEISSRPDSPMALVILDVDHFKATNDRFGHDAGDACLKALAALMQKTVLAPNLAGRWGGEEFLLVLCELDKAQALQACEQLRYGLENLRVEHAKQQLKMTASFGFATHERVLSYQDTLRDADRALYAAKAQGRNRLVSVESL